MPFSNVYSKVERHYNYVEPSETILNEYYYNDVYQTISFNNNNKKLLIKSKKNSYQYNFEMSINTEFNINYTNLIFYDDNKLWLGIGPQSDCNSGEEKYVFIIDLLNKDYKLFTYKSSKSSKFNVLNIEAIGSSQKYWTYNIGKTKNIYKWNELEILDFDVEPYKRNSAKSIYYSVNWKGASFVKLDFERFNGNTNNISFLNDDLNILFNIDAKTLFKNYKEIDKTKYTGEWWNTVTVNDNCLLFIENVDLIDNKHMIIENGFSCKYLYDFTNEREEIFTALDIEFFVSSGIPFRDKDGCKVLIHEWYPAGSWNSIYLPHSIEINKVFVRDLERHINDKKYDEAITFANEFIKKSEYYTEHYQNMSIEEFFREKLELMKRIYNECDKKESAIELCKYYCESSCINIMQISNKLWNEKCKTIFRFLQYYFNYHPEKDIVITEEEKNILQEIYEIKLLKTKSKNVPMSKPYRVSIVSEDSYAD